MTTLRNAMEAKIRQYRNADKRDFAIRYANWLLTGENRLTCGAQQDEPDSGLQFMAAQAVRMDLRAIVHKVQETIS